MASTVRSHRADRGSIPRIGAFFFHISRSTCFFHRFPKLTFSIAVKNLLNAATSDADLTFVLFNGPMCGLGHTPLKRSH